MKVIKTTGNRGLDEEIERILERLASLEKPVKAVKTPPTPTVRVLPPILNITPASTVTPVKAVSVVGILPSYALEDHVHAGLHSVAILSQPQITGDATLQAGTGMLLGQSGNNIVLNAVFGTVPPTVIATNYTALGGDITIFANTTGGAITLTLVGGAINTGRFIWVKNTGVGANNVTVAATSGGVISITSIAPRGGVLYHSDGTNWNSLMNSSGN